jgi:hypothetical protein
VALENIGASGGNGIAFIVAGGVVYEIIAANCSSPQTTELNADKRAATLMKWVHLGLAQAAVFVVVAAKVEPKRAPFIYAGGGLAAAFMYGLYIHGKRSGLEHGGPGTETY